MRNFITIVEALTAPENPEVGAGEPLTAETAPKVLYHGTNPIAAAAIVAAGKIEADFPVDDDDLGAVVCVTADKQMGRNFATEFSRFNSQYDVGVVFEIDGRVVAAHAETVPYHAETAGAFEFEYRVQDDIPMAMIRRVHIVGRVSRLKDERFIEQLWKDAVKSGMTRFFADERAFRVAIAELKIEAGK